MAGFLFLSMYRRVEAKDVIRERAQLSKRMMARGDGRAERPPRKRFGPEIPQPLHPAPLGFIDRFSLSRAVRDEELVGLRISEVTPFTDHITARRRLKKSVENSPPLVVSALEKVAEVWRFLPIPTKVAVGLSLIALLRGAEIQKINVGEVIYDARAAVTRVVDNLDSNLSLAPSGVKIAEAASSDRPSAPARLFSQDRVSRGEQPWSQRPVRERKITPPLVEQLEQLRSGETLHVLVLFDKEANLKGTAEIEDEEARREEAMRRLKATTKESQSGILASLADKVKEAAECGDSNPGFKYSPLLLVNGVEISGEATIVAGLIRELSQRDEIWGVDIVPEPQRVFVSTGFLCAKIPDETFGGTRNENSSHGCVKEIEEPYTGFGIKRICWEQEDSAAWLCTDFLFSTGNTTDLTPVVDACKLDLAARLEVNPDEIEVAGAEFHEWQGATPTCDQSGEGEGSTAGWVLALEAKGAQYTYHTDGVCWDGFRWDSCPPGTVLLCGERRRIYLPLVGNWRDKK